MRLFSAAILTLVILCCAFGQTYPVNTKGTATIPGPPVSVAVDGAGSLFLVAEELDAVLRLDVTTGVVTPVAGNGTAGFSGDGGLATSAQLNVPSGIAVDASGNLYIAEFLNQRIRKVSNGVITTVAGNGTEGFSGDNGPATSAQLKGPIGVAVDSAGNLYIADSGNNRIRKVSGGVITTVAGNGMRGCCEDDGPATRGLLRFPYRVAVDSTGNLYILDYGNNRIRKVSNGVSTTVAGGSGLAGFSGDNAPAADALLCIPQGLAVDAAGDLYIADRGNSRVRKVSNGVITTMAGNGTAGFSGDNGPATSAQVHLPLGLAVNAAGELYIADNLNGRIRKVSNGVITTVASTIAAPPGVGR